MKASHGLRVTALVALSMAAVAFAPPAQAYTVYTDLMAWQNAVATEPACAGATLITDDFETPIHQAQTITFPSGVTSTNSDLLGGMHAAAGCADAHDPVNAVANGCYRNSLDTQTTAKANSSTATWNLRPGTCAFAFDWIQMDLLTSFAKRLVVEGDFDGTGTQVVNVVEAIGTNNGFLGIVGTADIPSITFAVAPDNVIAVFSIESAHYVAHPKECTSGQIFNGSGSCTVPAGITSMTIHAIGGGGGGGKGGGGAAGGGGGSSCGGQDIPVTPGATLAVVVGAGGIGATTDLSSGTDGGYSEVTGAGVTGLRADGGSGGGTHTGGAGAGGTTAACTLASAAKYAGGNGGESLSSGGGGGGGGAGAAGSGEDGTAASSGTGAAGGPGGPGTPAGGAGGSGGNQFFSGVPGSAPGGGGGGAGEVCSDIYPGDCGVDFAGRCSEVLVQAVCALTCGVCQVGGDNGADGAGGSVTIGFDAPPPVTTHVLTVRSTGALDGWVRELSEHAGRGGTRNARANAILVGDDGARRQFHSFLSFDTSALPEDAVIKSATLKVRRKATRGTPFATLGTLWVDVRRGGFSGVNALQLRDFRAWATAFRAATLLDAPTAEGWYSTTLAPEALGAVNTAGVTQLRLRFGKGDDNDRRPDFVAFFSGNAAESDRPVLEVGYEVP